MEITVVNTECNESYSVSRTPEDTLETFTKQIGQELNIKYFRLLQNCEELDDSAFSVLMDGDEVEVEISNSGVATLTIEQSNYEATVNGLRDCIRQGKFKLISCFMEADVYSSDCVITAVRYGKSKIVNLLLAYQPRDVNIQDWGGNTPLVIATQRSYKRTVEVLLKRGADPTICNDQGVS